MDLDRVTQWLNKHARTQYKLKLEKEAAPLLFELAQGSFGIVEQGLVKLNLLLEDNADVSAQQVQSIVGGWKTETTWTLIDHESYYDDPPMGHLQANFEPFQRQVAENWVRSGADTA